MRTFSSEHGIVTHIRGLGSALRALDGRWSPWGRRGLGLLTERDTGILYLKSISGEEQLNTGGKGKCTFYLNRKGTIQTGDRSQKTHFLLRGTGDHFLTCLNKPKLTVWTKHSLFQAGCCSWLLASTRRNAGKCLLWKVAPSAGIQRDGGLCCVFTHPSQGAVTNYFLN